MKLVEKIKKKLVNDLKAIVENFKPFIRTRNYLGFTLYYSKGTSLIARLNNNNLYEPETCNIIHKVLSEISQPTFIDIGANIGLISLFVLSENSKAKVYAFEPGPHQADLLLKTIEKNNIKDRLIFERIALSNSDSYLEFFIHNTKDVSGDGFIDTERAGVTTSIKVKSKRLDDWWNEQQKPQIDMIKIDTEGAEFWVLEGASELIKTCRPLILTEMSKLNYCNYPYNEYDVLDLLHKYQYSVYNENGILTDKTNLSVFQKDGIDTYLCKPL